MPPVLARTMEISVAEAESLIRDGAPGAADNLLWKVLAKNPRDARAWELLSGIASSIGAGDVAHRYAVVAAGLRGQNPPPPPAATPRGPADGYLVIKAWVAGFCAELDHTLGALLLAEITGRTPVTHWGMDCLYSVDPRHDAFREYFEPVSPLRLDDVIADTCDGDFFPGRWNRDNLRTEKPHKAAARPRHSEDGWSRPAGFQFLHRPERVVVCDYHVSTISLVPWIPPEHPMHGRDVESVLRYLFAKYVRPLPDIRDRVESFASDHFKARPIIGVHVRGSDKYLEEAHLEQRQAMIPQAIERLTGRAVELNGRAAAQCPIFLITDSAPIAEQYRGRYGARLILPPAIRSKNDVGVHNLGHSDRRALGVEVIRDIYLAAKCDMFTGIGSSNVSAAIHHLKQWPPGSEIFLASIMTHEEDPNMYMHLEAMEPFLGKAWGDSMRALAGQSVQTSVALAR